MPSKPLLLLTDPAHFEVSYRINPWMQPRAWAEDPAGNLAAARRSFQALATALSAAGARLEIMPGVAGLPDMVFPANAAVVLDRRALVRGSAPPNAKAKSSISTSSIWDAARGRFWAGYGQRSARIIGRLAGAERDQ